MTRDDAAVFRALADPTRRELLDRLLARDGQALGELSRVFEPELTRFAIMKHLRVLEESGLVIVRKDGRRSLHYLNPVPIRAVSTRWVSKYAERHADSLLDLATELERTAMTDSATTAVPELSTPQLYQVFIRTTPERLWAAITRPESTKEFFYGARMTITPDRIHGLGPDDEVWADAGVEVFDPPHRLVYGWQSLYDPELEAEPVSRVTWEIEEAGDGFCRLVVIHDRLEGSPKTAANVSGAGWMFVLSNLKSWLETGTALR